MLASEHPYPARQNGFQSFQEDAPGIRDGLLTGADNIM